MALEGARGSGFVTATFNLVETGTVDFEGLDGSGSFFGRFVGLAPAFAEIIPVSVPIEFDAPYTLSFSIRQIACNGGDVLGCGTYSFDIANLSFTDANGNPLSGITLEQVPEPSSLCLLASGLIGLAAFFRIKKKPEGSAAGPA